MNIFTVALTDDFDPVAEQIQQTATATNQSKSTVIRDVLAAYYGFIPEKQARSYRKRY